MTVSTSSLVSAVWKTEKNEPEAEWYIIRITLKLSYHVDECRIDNFVAGSGKFAC